MLLSSSSFLFHFLNLTGLFIVLSSSGLSEGADFRNFTLKAFQRILKGLVISSNNCGHDVPPFPLGNQNLTWWPSELPSCQYMDMKVIDALAGLTAAVYHQPVPLFIKLKVTSDYCNTIHQLCPDIKIFHFIG